MQIRGTFACHTDIIASAIVLEGDMKRLMDAANTVIEILQSRTFRFDSHL